MLRLGLFLDLCFGSKKYFPLNYGKSVELNKTSSYKNRFGDLIWRVYAGHNCIFPTQI